jgi:hypothetical protein
VFSNAMVRPFGKAPKPGGKKKAKRA